MSRTGQHAVRTTRFPPAEPGRWAPHTHPVHELLWGTRGVLTVETADGFFAVPPTIGLWIPAEVEHAVQSAGGTGFFCTYVDGQVPPGVGARTAAVAVPPAARELLLHLHDHPLPEGTRRQAEQVAVALLAPVDVGPMSLPMPRDPRLASIARRLLDDPADERSLEGWGREVSVSVRNLSRLFHRETGMTFARWRVHARVRVAVGLLASGMPVSAVGRRVGYASPSAFVQAFRRTLGHTPGWYVATVRADERHPLAGSEDDGPVRAGEAWLG